MSQDALGLLITEAPPDDVSKAVGIVKMRFPVTYIGTQESILVLGGLLQLGDNTISRKTDGPNPKPSVISTSVLKVQLHRDQVERSWEEITQAPLRFIIRENPALNLCDGLQCGHDCPMAHKPLDEDLEQIILEIWSRSYHTAQGGKAQPPQADIFQAYMRIPTFALHNVIDAVVPGCYIEPRKDGVKGAHPEYGVVWLPRANYQSAVHSCRTCPHALSLVRFRDRYGVRVSIKDEQKVWEQLRPNDAYLDVRVREVYEISPVPHGTTKANISELLTAWGWKAKPLHSSRGTKDYMTWKIGADGPPPAGVLRGYDCDILINPIKQANDHVNVNHTIASWKTKAHLKQNASSSASTDPWQEKDADPKAKYQNNAMPKQQKDRTCLDTLTGSIQKELKAHLQKEFDNMKQDIDMEQHTDDPKMAELEGAVMELKAQNQTMQSWFNEASNKIQGLEQQAQQQHAAMQQQNQAILEVKQEIKGVATETASTLQIALQSIKQDLISQIQSDLGKMEAKLEKRPRHD